MWVFKTTAASMKGSQVGNRSAGRIGGTSVARRGTDLQNNAFESDLIRFSAGNGGPNT